jgi:hypothetical protein
MNNYFEQENDDFRDIPDEVSGNASDNVQTAQVRRQAQISTPVESEVEEPQEDVEEDFSAVLSDARLRLEQGRLYEMIMNHDLFAGSDADEKAIKHVQRQIRNFAKEQMEVMLGMRQDTSKAQPITASNFPFNDVEVTALKDLALMATKGDSASPEAQTFTAAAVKATKKMGLNSISMKSSVPKKVLPAKAESKPLASKAQSPIKRDPRTEAQIDQILREEGISRAEYDRQYNPAFKALSKSPDQMSEQELIEWRKQSALRSKQAAKNPNAIPMPSPEQEEMLHTQRAYSNMNNPQMQNIMNAIMKPKQ